MQLVSKLQHQYYYQHGHKWMAPKSQGIRSSMFVSSQKFFHSQTSNYAKNIW